MDDQSVWWSKCAILRHLLIFPSPLRDDTSSSNWNLIGRPNWNTSSSIGHISSIDRLLVHTVIFLGADGRQKAETFIASVTRDALRACRKTLRDSLFPSERSAIPAPKLEKTKLLRIRWSNCEFRKYINGPQNVAGFNMRKSDCAKSYKNEDILRFSDRPPIFCPKMRFFRPYCRIYHPVITPVFRVFVRKKIFPKNGIAEAPRDSAPRLGGERKSRKPQNSMQRAISLKFRWAHRAFWRVKILILKINDFLKNPLWAHPRAREIARCLGDSGFSTFPPPWGKRGASLNPKIFWQTRHFLIFRIFSKS